MISNGFCIGNGESRKELNISSLRHYGLIYGCNKAYLSEKFDLLISVDEYIINKIKESDFKGMFLYRQWTEDKKNLKPLRLSNFDNDGENILSEQTLDRGGCSGPLSIQIMAEQPGIKNIFMLGHDLCGVNGKIDGKINNLFKGTKGYGDEDSDAFYGNMIDQLKVVFEEYPEKYFYRVGNIEDEFPKEWSGLRNINFISYDEMWKKIIY